MANPAPTINQINAFNATQGTTIDFNIIGGTDLVRSNIIYIYDLSDNSLICTHLYVSTESIHELPSNTDASMVYESGKSSADFVNGAQYYAQIQTFTDIGGTEGGSGLSVAKMFWCLNDPTLTIDAIPSTISTTSYNVSATYNANTSVVSNIIQQYQFSLYSATGSLLQSSGVIVGNGEQQGTSTAYDISYNFTGLSVGSSYYVTIDVTTTQGMSVSAQSSTFTVSIDTPTLGEATVVNNACDGYISVTSNLSSEYGGSGSGEIVTFETDSENVFTKLQVTLSPTQTGSGTPSPSNVRPIYGHSGVDVNKSGKNLADPQGILNKTGWSVNDGIYSGASQNLEGYRIELPPDTERVAFQCEYKGETALRAGYFRFEYSDGTLGYIQCIGTSWRNISAVSTSGKKVDAVTFGYSNSVIMYLRNIQVEIGSTATEYEPYNPNSTTISQEFDVSLTPTSKDTDPYLFKAVGDIYGDRLEEELVGGSVVWNQILKYADFSQGLTGWSSYNATITTADNGCKITATGSWGNVYTLNAQDPQYVSGHKYLTHIVAKGENGGEYIGLNNNNGVNVKIADLTKTKTSYYKIFSATDTGTFKYSIMTNTSGNILYVYEVRLIDLTAFFGNATIADAIYAMETANAGDGVTFMRKYFPKLFSAEYDAGTLKSVNPTAHKMVGVNAWDEEWEVGSIDATTGQNYNTSIAFRSKNYIRCLENTAYYIFAPRGTTTYIRVFYYDASENLVGKSAWLYGLETITIPSVCAYMRFVVSQEGYGGTTYNHDICINISNPTINGKYFPYEEHTYDLGDVPLYGLFQLENGKLKAYGDVRHADGGTDRKFSLLDMGTLNWEKNGNIPQYFATMPIKTVERSTNAIVSNGYTISASGAYDGNIDKSLTFMGTTTSRIWVRDSNYSTATELKTAMNGVYLVYPLATPTTEQTDPFTQIQEVSKYGTLEYITTNDVPVGHNTTYMTRDVFGGYVDLASGRLVVDWVLGDFGDYTWTYNSTRDAFFTSIPNSAWFSGINMVSDRYEYLGTISDSAIASANTGSFGCGSYNGIQLKVKNTSYTNATTFKTAMTGAKFAYELATPLTYQLTPQQIQTLVGVNNVWSEQGDIELSYHIPITNLLVKRQDIDDVSGNWLTLYSQPITQASDMDFTFIDFLNQYGKTYKYALVPLLTQTQSGVEVEVEGGYTVSDEVQSIFDGVFISDSTGSQKCKANVGYGNVNMNQSVGSITPIGSQYPIIVTNSNNRYHNGSISGMIVPDDYYYNGNLSRIDMVNKRNELEQFLTNKRAKIIKDWNSNIWLVMIMDNIDCSFDNNYGMGIVTFNANWLEIGDPTNQEDLQATGLVNVGGV